MDPVTLALIGASVGGGLMDALGGGKKAKSIDPEWLKKHFGAQAVNQEMIEMFNRIISSPYGQQLIGSASEQGQQFEHEMAKTSAGAGFGPGAGADSGASVFSAASSGQAANSNVRNAQADLMAQIMPIAQGLVEGRMNIAAKSELDRLAIENSRPSGMQQIGQMVQGGANAALAAGGAPGQNAASGAGTAAPLEAAKGLPVNDINNALMQPNPVSMRTMAGGSMEATTPSGFSSAPYRKRKGFMGRLGNRVAGGMQRLSTPSTV